MKCEPKTLWIFCQQRVSYLRGQKVKSDDVLEAQWNAIYAKQPVEVQEIVARQLEEFMKNE